MRFEQLWTLQQGGGQVDAELRDRGALGVQLLLRRNGQFFSGRRFKLRRHAIGFSDRLRESFEAEGWLTCALPADAHDGQTLPR